MNKEYVIFHYDSVDTVSVTRNLIDLYEKGELDFNIDTVYELGPRIKYTEFVQLLPDEDESDESI